MVSIRICSYIAQVFGISVFESFSSFRYLAVYPPGHLDLCLGQCELVERISKGLERGFGVLLIVLGN